MAPLFSSLADDFDVPDNLWDSCAVSAGTMNIDIPLY